MGKQIYDSQAIYVKWRIWINHTTKHRNNANKFEKLRKNNKKMLATITITLKQTQQSYYNVILLLIVQ